MSKPKVPNLFIVGAPKCGTSALSTYLSRHPNIYMSEQAGNKEPHYFSSDFWIGKRVVSQWESYLRLFDGADESTIYLGEASANYMYSDEAVPRILAASPDAMFLVIVRSPIEIAIGLHNQHMKAAIEPEPEFEAAWRLQKARWKGESVPAYYPDGRFLQYGERARIGWQLERLINTVPRDQLHVMVFDDFVRDPAQVFTDILRFLGVDATWDHEFEVVNPSVRVRFRSVQRMLARIRNFRIKYGLPGGVGIHRLADRLNKIPGRSPVRGEFHRELVEYFRDDVERVGQLVGRDLQHWLERPFARDD